jgi:bisanhydrobacterioruberin hydratase
MEGLKKHKKSRSEQKQVLFILISYILYLILNILPFSREISTNLSELFYIIISLVIFSFIVKNNKKRLTAVFLFAIPAFFGIFLLQVVSVNNNEFFGSFSFGGAFAHKVAGVPFIISFFWLIIIFSALSLACKITVNNILRIVISSSFVVIFDFFLEPIAMKLDYWQWEKRAVPISNYFVWFSVSLILSITIILIKIEPRSQVSRSFFLIQIAFLVLLNIFL